MSRSNHNQSGKRNSEFWSRFNSEFGLWLAGPGRLGAKKLKQLTHRIARRTEKQRLRKEH